MENEMPSKVNETGASVVSSERLALSAGLIISACLIIYFVVLKITNLLPMVGLRVIDFLILGIGLFIAFRYHQSKTGRKMMYLQGLLFGLSISAFSTLPFAIFTGIYFEWLDPQSLFALRVNAPILGSNISAFKIGITTIVGGMGWGMVTSFLMMQYFQDDSAHEATNDEPKR
jgi:hypothetical protein